MTSLLPVGSKVRILRDRSLMTCLWDMVVTIETATIDNGTAEYTFTEIDWTLLGREVVAVEGK